MSIDFNTLLKEINGTILTEKKNFDGLKIEGGYTSDLLSDVMGNAKENNVWVTIMRHLNVIAVASLTGVSVIVFTKNITPEELVIDKANQENICLVNSPLSTFEVTGKIYQLMNK